MHQSGEVKHISMMHGVTLLRKQVTQHLMQLILTGLQAGFMIRNQGCIIIGQDTMMLVLVGLRRKTH